MHIFYKVRCTKSKELICTSLAHRKQSPQTKPSVGRQTCLAGDHIQQDGFWSCGTWTFMQNSWLLVYADSHQGPREAQRTGKWGCIKANEAAPLHHGVGSAGTPRDPCLGSLGASSFVHKPPRAKVSEHQPGLLSPPCGAHCPSTRI